MVQVDVVWAYAFGSTFAAATAHQLQREEKPFNNKSYTFILLFLAIFFAPSGLYLLWQFPQWETMQVAASRDDIPAWLVVIFAVTNITQGIAGYWTTYWLARRGRFQLAHANWMAAWIIFWFILACGWDGTGYQRFLYDASVMGGEPWAPGKHMGLSFFYGSNVFRALVVMALCFVPMLAYGMVSPGRAETARDSAHGGRLPGAPLSLALYLGTQWVICLGLAILAAAVVINLGDIFGHIAWGYAVGLPLIALVYYLALFRKGMPLRRIAARLSGSDV